MENIDIDIDIDMVILENIDIDIDIDKAILQNIDIDKISNRFKFGISNRATTGPIAGARIMIIISVKSALQPSNVQRRSLCCL